MRRLLWFCVVLAPVSLWADDADRLELAERAMQALEKGCYHCHDGNETNAGLNVLSPESLLQQLEEGVFVVVPGNPDQSRLWEAIVDGVMPPEGDHDVQVLTSDDRLAIYNWIVGGAPMPETREFQIVTEVQVLTAIRNHLFQADDEDCRHLRFFTLHHLHNNPTVSERDLRYTRAALSKLLNSLIWQSNDIVLPVALPETNDTVFVIDLRKIDWDDSIWETVLDHYPYGVHHQFSENADLKQLSADLLLRSGTSLPAVRADWFVVYAAQPPLYNVLLDLPDHLNGLEERLGIDIEQNILDGNVDRAAFSRSGVSQQNRLIERHELPSGGYFWISYDFKPRRPRGDLVRFPLGPIFEGNPFLQQAFQHDGGEIIWSLPNGMQAYMLILSDGTRLDDPGPIDIVYDSAAIMGTPAIINGVSCMNCHSQGMITRFRDEIRDAGVFGSDQRDRILELYPEHDEMAALIAADRDQFLVALERVTGPFLDESDQGEPIGKVVTRYFADLSAVEAACELGIDQVNNLQSAIELNDKLRSFGLGTLFGNSAASLQRTKWESIENSLTLFQEVFRVFEPNGMPRIPGALLP